MSDANGGNGDGGVRITQRAIYEMLLTIQTTVQRLVDRDETADGIHKDHEARIKVLEIAELKRSTADARDRRNDAARSEFWRWFVPAIAAVALVIVTVVQAVHP